MNKYRFPLAGALLLTAASATTTHAQFTGPGASVEAAPVVLRTVAEVLRKPVDDQHVELTGTLVRQLGREKFLFRDATGEIEVEIDNDDFPANQPVAADTRVVIAGEVDTRVMRKPEIDVETVRVPGAGVSP